MEKERKKRVERTDAEKAARAGLTEEEYIRVTRTSTQPTFNDYWMFGDLSLKATASDDPWNYGRSKAFKSRIEL